jgi:hypothetical protein
VSYPLYPADPTRDPAEPFRKLDTAPTAVVMTADEPRPDPWDEYARARPMTAEEANDRQREVFGGPKVGSAFFGWLIAGATGVILTGALAVVDRVLELGVIPDPWASGGIGPLDGVTVGWIVASGLFAIVLLSFYCGGYVAGRMARFSGVAQGLVVWLWAVVIAVIAAVVGAVLDGGNGLLDAVIANLPVLPGGDGFRLIAWIIAAVALVAASLGGAILGGVIGVRYHRRVDRAGLGD